MLYDFGNVLVGWDPYGAYDGVDRRDVDAFFADVDFRVLNHERDAGATWQDARDRVAATHPHHVALLDRYVERFPRRSPARSRAPRSSCASCVTWACGCTA